MNAIRPKTNPAAIAFAAAWLLLALGAVAAAEEGSPAEHPSLITDFVEGSNADAWGRGEADAVEVEGDPNEVRIRLPVDYLERKRVSEDQVGTRVVITAYGLASQPLKGSIGDDPLVPDAFPSYRRGWKVSQGGGIQVGFEAGVVGFFVETSFQIFRSEGQVFPGLGGWLRYSDIRIATLCPGFKLQFQNWLKFLYTGDATWDVGWFDYMMHSFPYVKFGVGPIICDGIEVSSDTSPAVEYLERGLSYTFFFAGGLEWRPFGRNVSAFFEIGIQAFVFTNETAYSHSPDWLTVMPVRLGITANF